MLIDDGLELFMESPLDICSSLGNALISFILDWMHWKMAKFFMQLRDGFKL